jgi:hypothetical protein
MRPRPMPKVPGIRLPIMEPVMMLPGLPNVPGEVRRPVPSLSPRTQRPLPIE